MWRGIIFSSSQPSSLCWGPGLLNLLQFSFHSPLTHVKELFYPPPNILPFVGAITVTFLPCSLPWGLSWSTPNILSHLMSDHRLLLISSSTWQGVMFSSSWGILCSSSQPFLLPWGWEVGRGNCLPLATSSFTWQGFMSPPSTVLIHLTRNYVLLLPSFFHLARIYLLLLPIFFPTLGL